MNKDKRNIFQNYVFGGFVSLVLLISMFGKASQFTASAMAMSELFFLTPLLAKAFTTLVILVEVIFVVLLWRWPRKILLALPALFLVVTIYSQARGLDCGCFGSLPLLSAMPIWGHYVLILAMALSIWLHVGMKTQALRFGWLKPVTALSIVLALGSIFAKNQPVAKFQKQAEIQQVQFEDVARVQFSSDTLLIDARSEMQYQFGTIGDAINIPHDTKQLSVLIEHYQLKQTPFIVFCSSEYCDLADLLCDRLKKAGCQNIMLFSGGWDEWVEREAFLE